LRKTPVRPAMAVVRSPGVRTVSQGGVHERSFLGLPELAVGPPVNWNLCLECMKEMSPDEERYRVEVESPDGSKVGIGHKECEGLAFC
jgi:hypothetical protein